MKSHTKPLLYDQIYAQLDVSTEEMENVDLYLQSLGVPARRNVNDPQVIKGEQNFYKAKCHLCHVTTLHTKPRGTVASVRFAADIGAPPHSVI